MSSSYTSSLGLVLPVQGELSGTWGDTVNNYLTTYVDTAVAGQLAISLTGNLTLTKTTGSSLGSTSSQYAILNVTPSASTWTITVPAASQIYHINNLSSTHTFTIKATGQTGFVVAAAEKCVVAYNGTDFVRVGSTSVFGAPSTAMTLDTNGNLGLGVTPSASWASNSDAIEVGSWGSASSNTTSGNLELTQNAIQSTNAGAFIYKNSSAATRYALALGSHLWYTAPSGTAGNAITFTQAMTLDTSGNLGIGTSSPDQKLVVNGKLGFSYTSSVSGNNIGNTGDTLGIYYYSAVTSTGSAIAHQFGSVVNAAAVSIDYSGNLLVGTTSVSNSAGWDKLAQIYATNYPALSLKNFYRQWDVAVDGNTGALRFWDATAAAERMRLDSSGNLGLGVTPSAWGSSFKGFQVGSGATLWSGASGFSGTYLNNNSYYNGTNRIYLQTGQATEYAQGSGQHIWYTAASGTAGNTITFTQAMTLDASGNLGIGISSPSGYGKLAVNGKLVNVGPSYYSSLIGCYYGNAAFYGNAVTVPNDSVIRWIPIIGGAAITDTQGYVTQGVFGIKKAADASFAYGAFIGVTSNSDSGPGREFLFDTGGNFSAPGSKSFRIPHPLPEKSKTHDLWHVALEGPSLDLIYRGTVDLVAGKAEVNIDAVSRMSEGTFVALTKDAQSFTSNESDWTPVRGSVNGNILSIEAQDNTATSSVSWMVIAKRNDAGVIDEQTTDDNGEFITERLAG